MDRYVIKSPGIYYQFSGSVNNVYDLIKHLGDKTILVTTDSNYNRVGYLIQASFPFNCKPHVFFVNDNYDINKLLLDIREVGTPINTVVGVGGGTVLDLAKYLSVKINSSCVMIPTVASNDSACTSMIVPKTYDNRDTMMIRMDKNPEVVIVDPNVLIKAPMRLTVSGIGDALATYYEARSCYVASGITMSHGDTPASLMSMATSLDISLISETEQALSDIENGIVSTFVDNLITNIIYLSGILSENCGLSIPHAFSLACDEVGLFKDKTHGEKVAFGVLILLLVEKFHGYGKLKEFKKVRKFMNSVGLPTNLNALGNYAVDDINKVALSIYNNKLFKNVPLKETIQESCIANIILSLNKG